MVEPVSFGRRIPKSAGVRPPPVQVAPLDEALDAQAEAFRASLAIDRSMSTPDFNDWLRRRQTRRVLAWMITFALLTPGALCFIFKAPIVISASCEIGGAMINFWLRRERRKHLTEIARWDAAP